MVIRAEPDNVKSFFTAAVLIRDPMRSLCDYVIRSAYFAAGSFFLGEQPREQRSVSELLGPVFLSTAAYCFGGSRRKLTLLALAICGRSLSVPILFWCSAHDNPPREYGRYVSQFRAFSASFDLSGSAKNAPFLRLYLSQLAFCVTASGNIQARADFV